MKRATKKVEAGRSATSQNASRLIDQRIQDLGDWRGETLARMRELILSCDPAIVEEWKCSRHG